MVKIHRILAAAGTLAAASLAALPALAAEITYKTVEVNGLDIFYREAGPATAPTVLLLHGFPSSSHMFRTLIPDLLPPQGGKGSFVWPNRAYAIALRVGGGRLTVWRIAH